MFKEVNKMYILVIIGTKLNSPYFHFVLEAYSIASYYLIYFTGFTVNNDKLKIQWLFSDMS